MGEVSVVIANDGKSNAPLLGLENFRRLVVRYERYIHIYQAFFHVVCMLISPRRF
jgi:hypothetical protein